LDPRRRRVHGDRSFRLLRLLAFFAHRIVRNPAVEAGRNPEPRTEELLPFSRDEIDALAAELGPVHGSLVVFAAETGLRTNELDPARTSRHRRRRPSRDRATPVRRRRPHPHPKTPLSSATTFATEAFAAGVSVFELSRLMGASVRTIDKTGTLRATPKRDPRPPGRASRTFWR
jgi:hypothetical protein